MKNSTSTMRARADLNQHKKQIGRCLYLLRLAKKHPDNYRPTHVQQIKGGLSLALLWMYRIRREHPEIVNPRCKQTSLDFTAQRQLRFKGKSSLVKTLAKEQGLPIIEDKLPF